MEREPFAVYKEMSDGLKMFIEHWPLAGGHLNGTILIAHGLGETALYYHEFSAIAGKHGFDVIVPELRGHGRTAGDIRDPGYRQSGGNPGPDSLHKMAEDINRVADEEKSDAPEKPVFLLGHSMGSVVAQLSAMARGDLYDGLLLTGVPSAQNAPALLGSIRDEMARRGPKAECKETFHVMFDRANEPFQPVKTPLDWITSDESMIRQSLALPYTAVMFNNEFYRDFLNALLETQQPERWLSAPPRLPVLLLDGGDDIMAQRGQSVQDKHELLSSLEFSDVRHKIYPGLRHSILREKSRRRVMDDIFHWMELRLKIRMCRVQ